MRQGDSKLYRNGRDQPELYDLASDVGESEDLADSEPERVAKMLDLHAEWVRGIIEPLWGRGALTGSTPDIRFRASPLGYHLEKRDAGFGYATYGLREALSLNEDWILDWRMESLDSTNRNGYAVLGAGVPGQGGGTLVVRLGVDFDTRTMSITELGSGAGAEVSVSELPPELLTEAAHFRVEYDALTSTLRLRYRDHEVSHVLFDTGTDLTNAGFALEADAAANFSSIQHHFLLLSPPASPSWTDLHSTTDYAPGAEDVDGNFMGGTEALSLIAHKGRLFAGIGYWNDEFFKEGSDDPYPGAQVLVKDAAGAPWRQDVAFGQRYLRTESLKPITLTTDKDGDPLDPPVTLLLAGTSPPVDTDDVPLYLDVFVWSRNDARVSGRGPRQAA